MSMSLLRRRDFLAGMAALATLAPAAVRAQATPPVGPLTPLVILGRDGRRHAFRVEVADTDAARAQGLMYRREMPADQGMLFDYGAGQPQEVAMWMKNTFIPLDMLFIRRDFTIANIAERTVPHSTASIFSDGPVRAVLELNGGATARLGIKAGDTVQHARFGNLAA